MTRIGMVVVDDFFFYLHVLKPKLQQRMGLQFSKILASQLIKNDNMNDLNLDGLNPDKYPSTEPKEK